MEQNNEKEIIQENASKKNYFTKLLSKFFPLNMIKGLNPKKISEIG